MACAPRQRTTTLSLPDAYLAVHFSFAAAPPPPLTPALAAAVVDGALRQLLGPVGAPRLAASLVGVRTADATAVVRVRAADAATLRAALALATAAPAAGGAPVALTVTAASRCLLTLASDPASFDAAAVGAAAP